MSNAGLLEPSRVPADFKSLALARRDNEEWKVETVPGWRFVRRPAWAMLTNIPVGGYLAPLEAPCVMSVQPKPPQPWSVIWPDGGRCGIPERWARELLEQDRVERTPLYNRALGLLADPSCASFVERDVPEADVRRGDVLTCMLWTRKKWRAEFFASVRGEVRGLCLGSTRP